jgi:hypothetical protein
MLLTDKSGKRGPARTALECSSCGAGIGPGFEHTFPDWAGDIPLCSFCKSIMRKDGYIQIDENHRLLPDGSVISERRVLPWS